MVRSTGPRSTSRSVMPLEESGSALRCRCLAACACLRVAVCLRDSPACLHAHSWTSTCQSASTCFTSGGCARPLGSVPAQTAHSPAHAGLPNPNGRHNQKASLALRSDANTKERPIMIHRAILGSLERFMGILIENYAGVQTRGARRPDRNPRNPWAAPCAVQVPSLSGWPPCSAG